MTWFLETGREILWGALGIAGWALVVVAAVAGLLVLAAAIGSLTRPSPVTGGSVQGEVAARPVGGFWGYFAAIVAMFGAFVGLLVFVG